MANTQSKCIPYAEDHHRLTNTNVAVATEGAKAETLLQKEGAALPAQPGAAPGSRSCRSPSQEQHLQLPELPFPFLTYTPCGWEKAGTR